MAQKDEQPVDKTADKGKGKLKLILIIVGAVVLAVGGTAAFFMFSGGGGKHDKGASAKESVSHAPPVIYSLEPFIVNIYDGQELRYLRLKVEMEVASEEVKAEMTPRQAQLRDAILVLLTTKTMLDVRDQQGKNQLRQEIFNAVGRILPPGKVKQIFFTDFVVQ